MGSLNNTIGRTLLRLGAASFTDGELLNRFVAAQEQEAFEELVRRHGPMVLRVCRRVLQHAHDAEDAFQAAFIVLARKASAVSRPELLSNWLYGVAQRIACKARAGAAKHRVCELTNGDLDSNHPTENGAHSEQDWRLTLDEELGRLPDKYRAALVLCYLEGKSNAEAARLMSCEVRAVEMRLTRGRRMLHGRLTCRGATLTAAAMEALLANEANAAITPQLAATTVQAATLAMGGPELGTAAISPEVKLLADAAMQGMARAKLRFVGVVLLGVLALGVGTTAYVSSDRSTSDANLAETNSPGAGIHGTEVPLPRPFEPIWPGVVPNPVGRAPAQLGLPDRIGAYEIEHDKRWDTLPGHSPDHKLYTAVLVCGKPGGKLICLPGNFFLLPTRDPVAWFNWSALHHTWWYQVVEPLIAAGKHEEARAAYQKWLTEHPRP